MAATRSSTGTRSARRVRPARRRASTRRPPSASSACPFPAPSKQSVYDAVRSYAWAGGGRPSSCTSADATTTGPCITVCYGTACSGDTDGAATTIRGTSVTVTASSSISLILPRLFGWTSFNVTGTTTMLVNS